MRRNRAGIRARQAAAAAVAFLWIGAAPAWGHATAEPPEKLPGRLDVLGFAIRHGCGDSPTTRVAVAIPDGMSAVEPEAHPGWQVTTTRDPAAADRVSQVVWSGGSLDAHVVETFSIRARFPDRPGTRLWFKVVQTCRQGELRWVEIPGPGERVDDFEHPASYVDLVAPGRSKADQAVAQGTAFAWFGMGGMVLLGGAALLAVRATRRGSS